MAVGRYSLAEQIARLEEPTSINYDPEDPHPPDLGVGGDPIRDHYLNVGLSALRNSLPSIVEPKYQGVRMSRKEIWNGSDDGRQFEDEGEDNSLHKEEVANETEVEDGSSVESDSTSGTESEDEPGQLEEDERQRSTKRNAPADGETEDFAHTLKKAREDDIRKGQAVKDQLSLWDTLLDTRIRLQKSMIAANRLPPPSRVEEFLQLSDCRNSAIAFLREASCLLDVLDELQHDLLTRNNIVTPPPSKRRKVESEADLENYSSAFVSATEDAAALEEALHPYLLQTLSKWSAKIQAVAPSALLSSNRGAFLKGNQNLKSAVQTIDENLKDGAKLLERTQVVRSQKTRIGVQQKELEAEIVDAELFDDTDFYQKLLRDLIDSRGRSVKDEDWVLLQKRKKAKKVVDTKASKGRKLRFEVHDKMQNFMVPVPVVGAWHDEQIDELFSSVLGKGFENTVVKSNEALGQNIELTGFRVFG